MTSECLHVCCHVTGFCCSLWWLMNAFMSAITSMCFVVAFFGWTLWRSPSLCNYPLTHAFYRLRGLCVTICYDPRRTTWASTHRLQRTILSEFAFCKKTQSCATYSKLSLKMSTFIHHITLEKCRQMISVSLREFVGTGKWCRKTGWQTEGAEGGWCVG